MNTINNHIVQKRIIEIKSKDVSICCPMPNENIWNLHPKIFLKITAPDNKVKCPYCNTEYRIFVK
ncbi:hypothetical protein CKSOR_00518 [Candidatus Kinetoplastibacterium sorsogonicusi]|uniref:Zinc finger CHCC-type domain-containing protein n=1 Tax=Candidatus Kinetoplastidibacterium kentomonadis TaxID=1576550 RepID=A0A3S7JAD1_9PROT|nr:zinc-finger domain-containing protein [Candidatus Kinetoplastibacterium sorsogonicusi]AWD32624.1 hypothetical protein CKSOR_00518 [Candidatus Kinetoplastibacterium sorsogonicusi]